MKLNNKLIQRITSVCAAVFVMVMCVGLFSVTAHAESLENYQISLLYRLYHPDNEKEWRKISTTFSNGGTYLFEPESVSDVPMDYHMQGTFRITVSNPDGSYLAKEGETFEFSITGLHLAFIVEDSYYVWKYTPDSIDVALVYDDGTWEYLRNVDWSFSSGTETHAIKIQTTAKQDVIKIQFRETTQQYKQTGVHGIFDSTIVAGNSITPTAIEVDIESKEAGLLKDIGNQIDSAINGTPEQNQQAQDAVGGLNSSTDKLDQLGDTMASVEKPTIDSNKISADSLVPDTSLLVLSSPFQALWENKQLLAMLTIVVTLVLVSWVFFGKKG